MSSILLTVFRYVVQTAAGAREAKDDLKKSI